MDTTDKYQHTVVEEKWAKTWEEAKLDTIDILQAGKPFYNLMMFPYPSAEGLHVGNMYAFTGSDIYGRFKRMQGYDVFEPIGLDGFGIHSENFAFKVGKHPMDQAAVSERRFYNQLHTIGAMYDWTRIVETYDPDYYRWTQWLFVQMFKHGLCYRGKAEVNWCPSCKTVLSDEQVIDSACERCGNIVQKKQLEQWFFKITAYAEKLLKNSYGLDWSEKIRVAQQAWIGKKEGINISYDVVGSKKKITVFTTTPVNFAATFLVISPEHLMVEKVTQKDRLRDVKLYIDSAKKITPEKRIMQRREKTGVFTGSYCLNHVTGEHIPVWISDFVLMSVGTGAIQACPGHDLRDFEFAKKFSLPIKRVVVGLDGDTSEIIRREQVIEHGPGTMVNSGFLNGLAFDEAMQKTMEYFEQKGWGKRVVTYHLRDWLISRQRYWGPPIPMIFCKTCSKVRKGERPDMPGWYPVPEKDLPVILPRIDDYKPGDDGVAPLAKHKEFYKTTCPGCGGNAVRETDVSDTFLDSSWYYLRYPSVAVGNPKQIPASLAGRQNSKSKSLETRLPDGQVGNWKLEIPWDREITRMWLPVHMYTGGAEHSVLHLMYSRFICMALHDMGHIDFDEPFATFYAHGLVIKDGAKMSKSKGNVVNPDEYIARYGVDALRLYLMFTGPYDQGGDFRDSAMEGMSRWVGKVWRLAMRSIAAYDSSDSLAPSTPSKHSSTTSATVKKALHRAIKKVGEDIERRRYNTAIAAMMELVNSVVEEGARPQTPERSARHRFGEAIADGRSDGGRGVMSIEDLKDFLKILAPFAPYMTEELWQRMKTANGKRQTEVNTSQYTFSKSNSIHLQPWPTHDPKILEEDTVEIIVQVNGKLRDTVVVSRRSSVVRKEVEEKARASRKVAKHLEGKTIRKSIYIPGKLVNFVAS